MRISGLQKTTLLDFPGRVACTIFLNGCNFRCPFCQNSEILDGRGGEDIPEEELFAFLRRRKGILDGVCVCSGGMAVRSEPLRQELRRCLAQEAPHLQLSDCREDAAYGSALLAMEITAR